MRDQIVDEERLSHVVSYRTIELEDKHCSGVVEIPEAPDARHERRSKGIETAELCGEGLECGNSTTARFLNCQNGVHAFKPHNVNVHRAAANILQAEKAARPAAPCATYCYPAFALLFSSQTLSCPSIGQPTSMGQSLETHQFRNTLSPP